MIDLVYIAAPSFSGSTLLTFLLNQHPSIATIGELKWGKIDLETYRCSCGLLLRQCAFWKTVEEEMHIRGLPFDLNRPLTDFRYHGYKITDRIVRSRVRGPVFETIRTLAIASLTPCQRSWPIITRVNRAMIEIILELQNASMFLDASKEPVRLRHLINTGDYNIRVIHLIRDGRAVTNSTMRHLNLTAACAAKEWVQTHQQIRRLKNNLRQKNVITIHYEDLCLNSNAILERIIRFLDLKIESDISEFRSSEHHILGNSMRLRGDRQIKLDQKWQTMMSPDDLAIFERIGGPINRQYQYA